MGKDPSTLVAKRLRSLNKPMTRRSALNPSTMFDNVPTLNASSLLENLGAYQNPYLRDVVDTTTSDYDVNSGRVRANQAAQAAQGGTSVGLAMPCARRTPRVSWRGAVRLLRLVCALMRSKPPLGFPVRMLTGDSLLVRSTLRRRSRWRRLSNRLRPRKSQLLAALGGQQQAQDQAEINAPYHAGSTGSGPASGAQSADVHGFDVEHEWNHDEQNVG